MVAVHGSSKMVVALRYRKYFEIVPSSSHALYNMGKISYNWIGTNPGLEEKTENERFTVVSSRSRSCRAEYGKKNCQNAFRTCSTLVFLHYFHCLVALSLPYPYPYP